MAAGPVRSHSAAVCRDVAGRRRPSPPSRRGARVRPHRPRPLRPGLYSAPPQRSPRRPNRLAGPSLREDSPRGRASAGTGGAVTGIPAIVVLLALGLVLRFIIAYVLLPGSGFPNDLAAFQGWGNDIAAHGPVGFYDRQASSTIRPSTCCCSAPSACLTGGNIGEGVKLVPMLADLALAAVVWLMVDGARASTATGVDRGRSSSWSTRSPGSTAPSGARPTRSARSSCCWACASSRRIAARRPRRWRSSPC